jgi:hypothetical protein
LLLILGRRRFAGHLILPVVLGLLLILLIGRPTLAEDGRGRRGQANGYAGGEKRTSETNESMHVQETNLWSHHKGRPPTTKVGGPRASVYTVSQIL